MTMTKSDSQFLFSIIVPCYNEEEAIAGTIQELHEAVPETETYEIIVVNDGSTDDTKRILDQIAGDYTNLHIVVHAKNRGYGAALKTGIRRAKAEIIVITDADGTYPNERIPELVHACREYDMVVGARTAEGVVHSKLRAIPKIFLRVWASWIAGQNIPDINSGLRVFRKSVVEKFLGILPDSFSFTLTITLALLTNYRPVYYIPITYHHRTGSSKIKPVRDTVRFINLILRTGIYFAPLRVLGPFIIILGLLAMGSLAHDIFILQNLTDKTTMLFLFTFNTGMFALLADMIDKRIG